MSTVAMDPRLAARRIEVLRLQGRRRLRVLGAVAALVGLAAAIVAATRSPLFDVEAVNVEGATHTSLDALEEITAPLYGRPLLEVDITTAKAQLAALPWVYEVSSDRGLDGTVTFTVTERTAVAAVAGADAWLLVDGAGRVLDEVTGPPAGIVAVDGVVLEAHAGDWASEQVLPAVRVAGALPPALVDAVVSVRVADTPEQGILLVLQGGGSVILGNDLDLDQKFVSTATMLDRVPMQCLDTIDVRAPSVPVLTREALCP